MSDEQREQEPVETRSVIKSMADRFQMDQRAFERVVVDQCMPAQKPGEPPWTMTEFVAFLLVCKEHNLNPITREIYCMRKKGGGLIPVVSVDGWIRKVNEHPQFDGMGFDEQHTDKGVLISTTCKIWRRDRGHPISVTEYLNECVRNTDPWKMQHRMLRHKALIQCARVAFGFAGIYDEDEAERFAEPQGRPQAVTARVPPPPPPVEGPKEARKPPEPPKVTDERQVRSTIPYGATPAEVEKIETQDRARHEREFMASAAKAVREAASQKPGSIPEEASYVDLAETGAFKGEDTPFGAGDPHENLLDDYHTDMDSCIDEHSLNAAQALYAPKLNGLPQSYRMRAEAIYEQHAQRLGVQ